MSDLENNVDEDGGFSLAQLAGFDASDVAEIRFENLPGGAYVFNGTGVKLEKTKNREDETRFKLTINLEVAEVKAVTERGVNKEELVGKKHNESFYIVPAKAEEGIGLIRAFYADIGLPNGRSEEHTSELQSLMRLSYAVFCLNKKNTAHTT